MKEVSKFQNLWARNKYLVLSKKSLRSYLYISSYLKTKQISLDILESKIRYAKNLYFSKKDYINALTHIREYFKKLASKD